MHWQNPLVQDLREFKKNPLNKKRSGLIRNYIPGKATGTGPDPAQ
jgi:hypothetical protein